MSPFICNTLAMAYFSCPPLMMALYPAICCLAWADFRFDPDGR